MDAVDAWMWLMLWWCMWFMQMVAALVIGKDNLSSIPLHCIVFVTECLSPSVCVCTIRVYQSARLTRVHSQHFEILADNSPGTVWKRLCGVMTMVSMKMLDVRWRRANCTSDSETRGRLHFARIPRLVMGWARAHVHLNLSAFCSSIAWDETSCLIKLPIECLQEHAISALYDASNINLQQLSFGMCFRLVPARFSNRVHLSWAAEVSVFTHVADVHISCCKSTNDLATIIRAINAHVETKTR